MELPLGINLSMRPLVQFRSSQRRRDRNKVSTWQRQASERQIQRPCTASPARWSLLDYLSLNQSASRQGNARVDQNRLNQPPLHNIARLALGSAHIAQKQNLEPSPRWKSLQSRYVGCRRAFAIASRSVLVCRSNRLQHHRGRRQLLRPVNAARFARLHRAVCILRLNIFLLFLCLGVYLAHAADGNQRHLQRGLAVRSRNSCCFENWIRLMARCK